MTSSISIVLGRIFSKSLMIFKTLESLDSPPETTVLGCKEIIESIKLLVSAIYEEISALMCYPKASGWYEMKIREFP